jgi:hypothetical protein
LTPPSEALPYPLNRLFDSSMVIDNRPGGLNLVGVRVHRNTPDAVDDVMYATWRDAPNGRWQARAWALETEPSSAYLMHPLNPAGCAIMAPDQYLGAYALGLHRGRPALVQVGPVRVYRDNNRDATVNFPSPDALQAQSGLFGINIHDIRGDLAGCQGLLPADMPELLLLAQAFTAKYGKAINYTLLEGA